MSEPGAESSTPETPAESAVAEWPAAEPAAAEAPAGESFQEPTVAEPDEVLEPDAVLLAARDQARAALAEITPAQTIGSDDGHEVHEAHVLSLFFECRLPGYPGWRWSATLARVDETSPVTVLEVELLPGAGAVTAPEWVPWSVRLAQYREAQTKQLADEAAAAEAAAAELSDEDEVDPAEDLLENDFSDFDDEIDGVDVDGADDEDDLDEDDHADEDDDDAEADDEFDDDEDEGLDDDEDDDDDLDDDDEADEFDHLDDDDDDDLEALVGELDRAGAAGDDEE